MDPIQNEPKTDGAIRIFNRERLRRRNHRRGFMVILAAGFLLTFALVLMLIMKNYTDQRIIEANNLLEKESAQYIELERIIYRRENLRRVFDQFEGNMVGVALTRGAFKENSPGRLATGLVYGEGGYVLVPSRLVRGQTRAYVRYFQDGEELIQEGVVIGIDEASGLALLDVADIDRESPVTQAAEMPILAEAVILAGKPQGESDRGNLSLGEVHEDTNFYTIRTSTGDTSLSLFVMSAPVYIGNDGGAALTFSGKLAGMVSLELTERMGIRPYTAVIPAQELTRIVERIRNLHLASSINLGAEGGMIEVEELDRLGFYVLEVEEGSTAHRGGIQPTDIILSIDGQAMDQTRSIDGYLQGKGPGDSVTVLLYRGDQILSMILKIY